MINPLAPVRRIHVWMGALKRGSLLGLAALVILPAGAHADHHLMKIREVGSGPVPYVELQAYAPFQTLLGGHTITYYDSAGAELRTFTFPSSPPGGPLNTGTQRTFLISSGTPEGVTADYPDPMLSIPVAGGALCFNTDPASFTDCVSWGTFSGMLPSSAGTPVTGFAAPGAITRTIAPGCATLLEAADDSNNSAADFSPGSRTPRNNATPPTETTCGGGGGGGGTSDTEPPETRITKGPDKKTGKRKLKVKFESTEPGSSFQCKLDKRAFKACDSPFKKRVDEGRHKFSVFAIDAAGNRDATPAKLKFKVVGD
jgi:hypothetical protein